MNTLDTKPHSETVAQKNAPQASSEAAASKTTAARSRTAAEALAQRLGITGLVTTKVIAYPGGD